jgi:hypothetical protein
MKGLETSVGDPDVLGLPDPDPLVRNTDSVPDPSFSHIGVERTEIMIAK